MQNRITGCAFLLLSFTHLVMAHEPDFPIRVECGSDASTKTLFIGLKPLEQVAYLRYQDEADSPLTLSVHKAGGHDSGSFVSIESSSSKRLFHESQTLVLKASMLEVLRITRNLEFSVTLNKNDDEDTFTASELTYSFDIDAFPDQANKETISLSGLKCSISGL